MSLTEKADYQFLSSKVWNDNEIQSALKEWYEILKMVKDKWNNELYKKFSKEYEDLEKSIKIAIEDDKKISIWERTRIMLELWDVIKLAEDNWIIEKKWFFDNLVSKSGDFVKSTNTKDIKEKSKNLKDKKIENYSKEEAHYALTYLNENYLDTTKYKVVDSSTEKLLTLNYKTINKLDDQYEVRLFQELLVEKILWKWHKGYNNEGYIMAFHKNLWNYLTNTPIVEQAIKNNNFQKVWNLAICNYLNYLEWTWKLTKEYFLNTFWKEKSEEILKFVEKNKGEKWFEWYQNSSTIIQMLKSLKSITFTLLDSIINSKDTQEFEIKLAEIKLLKEDEKIKLLNELQIEITKENSKLRDMFLQPLLEKWKSPKEADKIVKEVIEKINNNLTPSKLWQALIEIENFNKKYKTNINSKNTINSASNIISLNTHSQIIKSSIDIDEAKKSWDKQKWDEAKKELEISLFKKAESEAVKKILDKTSDEELKLIWLWKIDYKTHLEEMRKKDKVLDKELKNLEKEEQEFSKKYPEELINKNSDNNQSWVKENIFSYSDWTTLNYLESSWEYSIKTSNWNIEINNKEFNIIKNSKEALNNLINFRETLDELWLSKLWNYREDIFQSLKDVYGFVSFDTAWDFIDKNELNKFLKSILKSVLIESNSDNIETTKMQFISENNISVIWWAQKVWSFDRTNIEREFFNKFIRQDDKNFRSDLFETALKNKV